MTTNVAAMSTVSTIHATAPHSMNWASVSMSLVTRATSAPRRVLVVLGHRQAVDVVERPHPQRQQAGLGRPHQAQVRGPPHEVQRLTIRTAAAAQAGSTKPGPEPAVVQHAPVEDLLDQDRDRQLARRGDHRHAPASSAMPWRSSGVAARPRRSTSTAPASRSRSSSGVTGDRPARRRAAPAGPPRPAARPPGAPGSPGPVRARARRSSGAVTPAPPPGRRGPGPRRRARSATRSACEPRGGDAPALEEHHPVGQRDGRHPVGDDQRGGVQRACAGPSRICCSIVGSTADVASSSISSPGRRSSARARASRWRCPPDSVTPRSPSSWSSPCGQPGDEPVGPGPGERPAHVVVVDRLARA